MSPTTPQEWLPILAKALDAAHPRIARLRSYANGHAPLPEMGKNLRASWEAFQRKARTNYGGLAVGSLGDRIRPNGISIGTSTDSPAVRAARRVWVDNRLDVQIADAIKDYLVTSRGYLVVGLGDDGRAVVTREKPEQLYAEPDALRPWKAQAFIKVWRDKTTGKDWAKVTMAGASQLFTRPSKNMTGSVVTTAWSADWEAAGEVALFEGDPAVVILEREACLGLFEPHLDVIDRINLGKLQRLVITAMQAFRQRALKTAKDTRGLPDVDADGNAIDYKTTFESAPGALWELPEGIDIWESTPADINQLLAAEKTDARDFAAAVRTPISVFTPDGANQTAEGAASAKESQVFQAKDEIARIGPCLAVLVVYILRAEQVPLGDDVVQILWAPPEHVSLSEKYAAAVQAKAAGQSRKSILRDILGYSPDQIAQDALDLAEEQLAALTMIESSSPQPVDLTAPAAPAQPAETPEMIKIRADAFGVLTRASVTPEEAALAVGFTGLKFTGAMPTSLRLPEPEETAAVAAPADGEQ